MRIFDLFENHPDEEHFDALHKTGFFGAAGAGCVFLARSTGRLLICHRSEYVERPGTWGGWGGAINSSRAQATSPRRACYSSRYPARFAGPVAFIQPVHRPSDGQIAAATRQ